jgi:hypothetical protein
LIHLYNSDLYIADPWPAIYIKSIDALAIADLHLGIEGVLAEEGVFLPRNVSRVTVDMVMDILEDYSPSMLILNGDIKHGFGLLNTSEWVTVKDLFKRLSEMELEVIVVKGNHDNYLGVVLDRYGIDLFERFDVGIYSFTHGHIMYSWDELNEVIVIGHEHPSVSLVDDVGVKYKFKCFLWGDYRGHRILILPSLGELATGSSINVYLGEYLSPLLRGLDMGSFKPYAIVPGEVVQELPILRELGKNI